jgi:hypothetical protein
VFALVLKYTYEGEHTIFGLLGKIPPQIHWVRNSYSVIGFIDVIIWTWYFHLDILFINADQLSFIFLG